MQHLNTITLLKIHMCTFILVKIVTNIIDNRQQQQISWKSAFKKEIPKTSRKKTKFPDFSLTTIFLPDFSRVSRSVGSLKVYKEKCFLSNCDHNIWHDVKFNQKMSKCFENER